MDLTRPSPGRVSDGDSVDTDPAFSSSFSTLQASWTGFQDYESGLAEYDITVWRQAVGEASPTAVYQESLDGMEEGVTINQLHLENGDFVQVEVTGVNGAGGGTSATSSGVTIDLSPPELTAIVDGSNLHDDLQYQAVNDTLSVSWAVRDAESEIERILTSVYEVREGRRLKIYPDDESDGEMIPVSEMSWVFSGLELNSGSRYITSLTFFNGAGLEILHMTDGVIVDSTPPTVASVSVLSDSYLDTGDTGEMVVMVADPNQTEVRWVGLDYESGIQSYLVGVVDENGTLVGPGYTRFDGTVSGGVIQVADLTPDDLYRVAVIAMNHAGTSSEPAYSELYRYCIMFIVMGVDKNVSV